MPQEQKSFSEIRLEEAINLYKKETARTKELSRIKKELVEANKKIDTLTKQLTDRDQKILSLEEEIKKREEACAEADKLKRQLVMKEKEMIIVNRKVDKLMSRIEKEAQQILPKIEEPPKKEAPSKVTWVMSSDVKSTRLRRSRRQR
jgi:uncharacterized protein (DUF3084 family)